MSEYSTTPKVVFEKDRRVGIITLNNGEMNVFNVEQVQGLRDLIVKLGSDDRIRALIIKGSGDRAFSAGFDLKNFDVPIFVRDGQDMIFSSITFRNRPSHWCMAFPLGLHSLSP